MGGRLAVDSIEGVGSTFHFALPLGIAPLPPDGDPTLAPPDLDGIPVLVVDDNATNRALLAGMLRQSRMRPTVVDSGAAALDALEEASRRSEPFAAVLLDARMPGLDGFGVIEQIRQREDVANATVLMLTSDDRAGDSTRCRELGVTSYLVKPITHADLLASLVTALAGMPKREARPSRVTPSQARTTGLRVLVAEDNAINQLLAVALLTREGHTVTMVGDGAAAVEAAKRETPDVIFMDVQMPGMNGFDATAAIRAYERELGRHTRIVAMTAHAMEGDRERCLAAGMDSYISKPIRVGDLQRVLAAEDAPQPR
jgi:two-component system, sensor histidine kinase and response regulator